MTAGGSTEDSVRVERPVCNQVHVHRLYELGHVFCGGQVVAAGCGWDSGSGTSFEARFLSPLQVSSFRGHFPQFPITWYRSDASTPSASDAGQSRQPRGHYTTPPRPPPTHHPLRPVWVAAGGMRLTAARSSERTREGALVPVPSALTVASGGRYEPTCMPEVT